METCISWAILLSNMKEEKIKEQVEVIWGKRETKSRTGTEQTKKRKRKKIYREHKKWNDVDRIGENKKKAVKKKYITNCLSLQSLWFSDAKLTP